MYAERPSALPGAVLWSSTAGTSAVVVPDGCLDLIWFGDRLVVAGPDTGPQPAGASPTDLVGLRFAPGTAPTLLGVPADELTDRRVDLAELWPAGVVARFEAAVARDAVALERRWSLGPGRTVEGRVAALCARGAGTAELVAATGWSERTLHRRCRTAFGYGAKTLTRVLRFRRADALLWAGRPPAEVAAATGYADQAHLSREVRALSGMTPTQRRQ